MRALRGYVVLLGLVGLVGCGTGRSVVGGPGDDAGPDTSTVDITDVSDLGVDTGTDAGMDATMDATDAMPRCVGNASCAAPTGVCDLASGQCVACLASNDTCPSGRYCDSANRCVEGCRNDEGCRVAVDGGMTAGARCNVATHQCVACVSDDHCPIGQRCMGNTCVMGCDNDARCGAGQRCCNGGCVNPQSNVSNCGACGTVCAGANAVPACVVGQCAVMSCTSGFGNCDTNVLNGCEVDTRTSVTHCGQCGRACAFANAAESCVDGVCRMGACDMGFADCDGDPSNGCEVNTQLSPDHCGACNASCMRPGVIATCANGVCQTVCSGGAFGDCDGNAANGCETNTQTTFAHCGGCGMACARPNGTATCNAGICTFGACNAGFANCDGTTLNGCEVDTRTSVSDCGGCGQGCNLANANAVCTAGACAIGTCNAGFGNCDTSVTNGCETDLRTTNTHCGMCGRVCTTTQRCESGQCVALPKSCAEIRVRNPQAANGAFTVLPTGAAGPLAVTCVFITNGPAYTLLPGRSGVINPTNTAAACVAGTEPFRVDSLTAATTLRDYVRTLSNNGTFYYANFYTGPNQNCPALAPQTGWLRSANEWVSANITPSALAPLNIVDNCNNVSVWDPVPVSDRDGFSNRASGGMVLLNHTERADTGTTVCAVNVPVCESGFADCDGNPDNGCEIDLQRDPANCARCGATCSGSTPACGLGTCVADCRLPGAAACATGRVCDFTSGGCVAVDASCLLQGTFRTCGQQQCGPGTYCDPNTTRCTAFGACQNVVCDTTGRCYGRDCPCVRPATCTPPSLTALNASNFLGGLISIDMDDACNMYGSTNISGTDYVRRLTPNGALTVWPSVTNLNMSEVAVQRAATVTDPVIATGYSCCSACGCQSNPIQGIGLVDRVSNNVPMIAGATPSSGVSPLPGFEAATEGPLGLVVAPSGVLFFGNLRTSGDFFRLENRTATPMLLTTFTRRVHASTLLDPRTMLVAIDNGDVFQLDTAVSSTPTRVISLGAGVASMRLDVFTGRIFASLSDRRVVSFNPDGTDLRTITTAAAAVRIAFSPDGALYLLRPYGASITRIEVSDLR